MSKIRRIASHFILKGKSNRSVGKNIDVPEHGGQEFVMLLMFARDNQALGCKIDVFFPLEKLEKIIRRKRFQQRLVMLNATTVNK